MSMRIRKSISPWTFAIFILSLAALAVIVITLNKPLPTYLVAKRALVPGEQLTAQDVDFLNLDLGPLESNYLREIPADLAVRSAVPAGELIPVSRLGTQLSENQTAIRILPATKPASSVVAGTLVSVWQVVEVEGQFQPQQLVATAEVAAVQYGEGLFSEEIPEVELLVGREQAMLVITALAADFDVFVLPVK
jgi:hypothetical protein